MTQSQQLQSQQSQSQSQAQRRKMTCILIANRGEVVSRVARTAARLGIRAVGVYADSDAGGRYLDDVDVSVALGDDQSSSPYLSIEAILDAARRAGADAIHPGYGFLAENTEFAQAVLDAGLVWIGPPPSAITAMGGKIGAKEIAQRAGVPVLGSVTVGDDVARAVEEASGLQPPLLVKPSAGGGGKGMHRVDDMSKLEGALLSAAREAKASFGDGTLFVEQYLTAPRHVEVQVFADAHGNVIHLGDRDCSVQRRHQKIIEEAPAPATNPAESREQMAAAAVALAKEIGYQGAGTVEYLAYDGGFAFLEMNTRLQVEHAVTEEVTGADLVEWQIRVAEGETLPLTQDQVSLAGHSIEARLYAEDPANDFLPSPGTVEHFGVPQIEGVRWEIGIESGSGVSSRYDPMIAKVVAHGRDRHQGIDRLVAALRGIEMQGVKTNRDLLIACLTDPELASGPVGTDYLDRRPELLQAGEDPQLVEEFATVAAIHAALVAAERPAVQAFAPIGWRNMRSAGIRSRFRHGGEDIWVEFHQHRDSSWSATVGETTRSVRVVKYDGESLTAQIDGMRTRYAVTAAAHTSVQSVRGAVEFTAISATSDEDEDGIAGSIIAPLPGLVISVEVAVGDDVSAEQELIVLEAMKMEHRLTAGAAGRVTEILVGVGDTVDYHDPLLVVEEA